MITYGSMCSGIEAATVAWESLGWKPSFFSEIKPFPCKLLAYHYPKIPNLGDITQIYENQIFKESKLDLLVAGTPCQSFSIAGQRGGLDDPRGDLALEFLRLVKIKQPKWIIWENVAGVLTSNKGRDFGAFINSMGECGYGIAYRILDAQYFGVPQTRRRVFVIGYIGDWKPAYEVLFNEEMYNGDSSQNENWQTSLSVAPSNIEDNGRICSTLTRNVHGGFEVDKIVIGTLKSSYFKSYNDAESVDKLFVEEKRLRRLMPIECERLQGFPDNYTLIPGSSDSARYEAIGNSMAIPVMHWIGSRINEYEKLNKDNNE
jgi:DNA (cytosine-5)-methyltransferase 1